MSNLSIFKIGVGPSSSHTLGPMLAGNLFCKKILPNLDSIARVKAVLHGSLSLTGRGHLSDRAIIWGLSNLKAKELDSTTQQNVIDSAFNGQNLCLCGVKNIHFEYERDIVFCDDFLPFHQNGLILYALDYQDNVLEEETYYSIGGGYVLRGDELANPNSTATAAAENLDITINNAQDILRLCDENNWKLSELSFNYELQFNTKHEIRDYCLEIWEVMQEVYYNGVHPKEMVLPGSLQLRRRAKGLSERINLTSDPMGIIDFISLYAIAIAEENASGARVVTAPTNGACAVVPAVMLYFKNHSVGFNDNKAIDFLLVAMLIGALYKQNASISGAEAGCQAEIGSASSMAAAAMADVMGANAHTACSAAEAAMEHHLGLTCDPVSGLVQIPCIERNAFGAIKAISAARMAMSRKSTPRVSLDDIIKTMYETGKDMNVKYKETSLGGLARTLLNIC